MATLALLSTLSWELSPPHLTRSVLDRIEELVPLGDPYIKEKRESNRMALTLLPDLRREVARASSPLERALRYSVAGNVVDLAARDSVSRQDLLDELDQAAGALMDQRALETLQERLREARSILFLADNAGEIVLDRLLLEQLEPGRVTVVVRGGPVINDATMEDALDVGFHEVASLKESGVSLPGTSLEVCSPDVQRRFWEADLVIAKGQGNFETLWGTPKEGLFYLFKVKCVLVSAHARKPQGSLVVLEAPHGLSSSS